LLWLNAYSMSRIAPRKTKTPITRITRGVTSSFFCDSLWLRAGDVDAPVCPIVSYHPDCYPKYPYYDNPGPRVETGESLFHMRSNSYPMSSKTKVIAAARDANLPIRPHQ
jgi:hypothetical protein